MHGICPYHTTPPSCKLCTRSVALCSISKPVRPIAGGDKQSAGHRGQRTPERKRAHSTPEGRRQQGRKGTSGKGGNTGFIQHPSQGLRKENRKGTGGRTSSKGSKGAVDHASNCQQLPASASKHERGRLKGVLEMGSNPSPFWSSLLCCCGCEGCGGCLFVGSAETGSPQPI